MQPPRPRLSALAPWNLSTPEPPAPWSLADDGSTRWPSAVLVVASTPRSGSTLLCRALGGTGLVGWPDEYFEIPIVSRFRAQWGLPRLTLRGRAGAVRRRLEGHPAWWVSPRYTDASMVEYRDRLFQAVTTQEGRFATKVHILNHELFRGGPWDPMTWGVPVQWIHIRRRDAVAQAVSHVRAHQTGAWNSDVADARPPAYDRARLDTVIRRIHRASEVWRTMVAEEQLDPIEVEYEELASNYDAEVRRVVAALGLPDVPVPPPPLQRQADELNAEWAARYRAESDGAHP